MSQPTMKSFSLGVIICAAGRSERMGGTDKINYPLGGKAVYRWAAEAFLAYAHTARLVVAVPPEKLAAFSAQGSDDPRIVYCAGGTVRQETVTKAAALLGKTDLIAVHDGARPFAGMELIDAVCRAALQYGAAIPALPVTDTIHIAENSFAAATPDRKTLFAAQTPQVFSRAAFEKILQYEKESSCILTDECSAAVGCGIACRIVPGSAENLKITAAEDLPAAERIAARLQCGEPAAAGRLPQRGGFDAP